MSRLFLSAILAAAIPAVFLLSSCISASGKFVISPGETPAIEESKKYTITDYKNRNRREGIPEWVRLWLDSDIYAVEALGSFHNNYLFISRSEGNNFTALNLWNDGFSPELDFPRLAAVRIEERLSAYVLHPDLEYGAFFETIIRAAADSPWRWMVKEDDFWIRRNFISDDDRPDREDWEFFVLVSMEKTLFASQLNSLFESITPHPKPTEEQAKAIDRVKDRFFEGF